ncbi:NepR family anti-sigma factor [Paenirhodobacter sp.]|uniref:NepR family anti-sigma factor n=1 Tax=Paenirhodobacter sp. TaxID=1965326 RepID=UPI003B402A0D
MLEESQEDRAQANLREQINENLRRAYEDALKEEVPDRFRLLLEQLREKERRT